MGKLYFIQNRFYETYSSFLRKLTHRFFNRAAIAHLQPVSHALFSEINSTCQHLPSSPINQRISRVGGITSDQWSSHEGKPSVKPPGRDIKAIISFWSFCHITAIVE